jgi:hypothetical protein
MQAPTIAAIMVVVAIARAPAKSRLARRLIPASD